MKLTRREVLAYLRNIVATAGVLPLLPAPLLATPKEKDHFFIFVELMGGIHYGITTDCPDPSLLPNDPEIFIPLTLNDRGIAISPSLSTLTEEQKSLLESELAYTSNGYCAALPINGNSHGMTSAGYRYGLGWAGSPLKNYTDRISVLRGVFMQGTFHGSANIELYTGGVGGSKPHIAGVLTDLLPEEKPLDNLVLDSATYLSNDKNLPAVKLTSNAINRVIEKIDKATANTDASRQILTALQSKYSGMDKIIGQYLAALSSLQDIKAKIAKSNHAPGNLSANLAEQLKLCSSFFKNGLTNIATVAVGNRPPFGGFDSHSFLYADNGEGGSFANRIKDTMAAIASFIDSVESDPALHGKVTLVVSSDFGRNNNFAGSDVRFSSITPGPTNNEEETPTVNPIGVLGNGHFFPNNNYLFYGKGIKGGVWLGESDAVLRYPYCVDLKNLSDATASNIANFFFDPFTKESRTVGGYLVAKEGFNYPGLVYDASAGVLDISYPFKSSHPDTIRALMVKDVIRTLMHCAGKEDKHEEKYGKDKSYAITQLLK